MTLLDDAALRALARLEIGVSRRRTGGDGGRSAGRRGGRVEFAEHRAYAPGDDVRMIDWSAHARTGRLFVKEFEADEGLDVAIVLDTSASMASGGKLLAAQRLAYALGWVALRSGARVRVALAKGGGLAVSDEVSGAAGAAALGDSLQREGAVGGTRLSESLSKLPATSRGARLVVLLSDFLADDDGRRALAVFAERGDDIVIVHLRSNQDLDAADAGDVVLEDAETGEQIAPDAAAPDRARRFAVRQEEAWREFAAKRRLRYVPVDASARFDVAMVRMLRASGVVA
ncbi:MAG: DUF58 domain-containing protein [Planctomycetes bacterium]|nr:DUF58 domain-containing protein [Planctomycetota bacterium]